MEVRSCAMAAPWFQGASVYQIYPRSFADSDGDGIGDLAGITAHLDHVASLGVDAIWLSPFFPSPQRDFGYDITDYCDVDPAYGTLETFDALVAAAHERGLRVVIDAVFNHTSEEHPWFVASRSSRDDPKADWYVWGDGRDGKPPNNWRSVDFIHSAWTYDEGRGQWFLATFDPCQPDLNWHHPDVRAAMFDVVRFWLDRGVDGFRFDMFGAIMKDGKLRDEAWAPRLSTDFQVVRVTDRSRTNNTEACYQLGRDLRALCIEHRGADEVLLVGECFGALPELARYTEGGDGLTHAFIFDALTFRYRAGWFRGAIDRYEEAFPAPLDPAWVYENHDRSRSISRVGDDLAKARVLATVLCTVRGQPTIYMGQELGMPNTYIPLRDALDVVAQRFSWVPERVSKRLPERLNRDEMRTPMLWDPSSTGGFCPEGITPWLPVNPLVATRNVAVQEEDPTSLLVLYRRLLHLRREHRALRAGRLDLVPGTGDDVLAYVRSDGEERVLVAACFGRGAATVALGGTGTLLVGTDVTAAVAGDVLRLGPNSAALVLLDPAPA